MTEPPGSRPEHAATPPPPPGEIIEGPGAGAPPPHHDYHPLAPSAAAPSNDAAPVPAQHPHPGADPTPPAPSSLGWPERAGSHRAAGPQPAATGDDAAAPAWSVQPSDPPAAAPSIPPDWRPPAEGPGPGQGPPLWSGPHDQAPPAPHPGSPAAAAPHGPPGAPWQAQPAPPLSTPHQPVGPRPEDDRGWSQAQGSAANWNYVDAIRSSELVPSRRIPPARGWRKAVYEASFKLVNLGQSTDERYQGELETKIRSLLRGRYKIAVLGKGGVGKSTLAAAVGSVFAELRKDDRVVAVDADTAFGKLGSRIDPAASGSFWELASDRQLYTFGDIRSRLGSNTCGLFVLPGEAATARRRVVDAAIYREAATLLDRHFTLSILDCGATLDSPVTHEVLDDADALIVVSSPWYDGASAAGQTLEWLANGGYTGLLHRTVVVINDSDGHAAQRDRRLLMERFGGRGQKVIELPYDAHLRPGGVIDVKNDINALTRRRLMELAAACAEHFAATTDRPRGVS